MNATGITLVTYFSERDRSGTRLLAEALSELYARRRVDTSLLLRGVEGFGQRNRLQTDRLLTLSENLPAVSIAVGAGSLIQQIVPDVLRLLSHGVLSLEPTQLLSGADLRRLQLPRDSGDTLKLTLYGAASVRSADYAEAIDLLGRSGAVAASLQLAIDGTVGGVRQRPRFFGRGSKQPVMLTALGDAKNIRTALPALPDLLDSSAGTIETVQICKCDGSHIAAPGDAPDGELSAWPSWHKLSIYVEQQAKIGSRPLYHELVRSVREAGVAGCTVLRGVRGLFGGRRVLADRFLQLRRNVPVLVVVLDTAESVQRVWPLVDELTRESGLVTNQLMRVARGGATE